MNNRPSGPPLGIVLANTARDVGRAFDAALAKAGGSRPLWLVLMSLRNKPLSNQRELADLVGIQEATLTHHLNAMEQNGLLTRRRDPRNRRVHIVELTESGELAFHRMLQTVISFDRRLRMGLDETELDRVRKTLAKLLQNVRTEPPVTEWEVIAGATTTEKGPPHGNDISDDS